MVSLRGERRLHGEVADRRRHRHDVSNGEARGED